MRLPIPLARPSFLPDPTPLVVGWVAVRHLVRDRGTCSCWICGKETRRAATLRS